MVAEILKTVQLQMPSTQNITLHSLSVDLVKFYIQNLELLLKFSTSASSGNDMIKGTLYSSIPRRVNGRM